MPKEQYKKDNGYRLQTNTAVIASNAIKYPFWMARIYGGVPIPYMEQVPYFADRPTTLAGVLGALVVMMVCLRAVRTKPDLRLAALLLLALIGIFAMIPIYSGGYLWHANLSMVGY